MYIVKADGRWVGHMIGDTPEMLGVLSDWDQAYKFLDFAGAWGVAAKLPGGQVVKITLTVVCENI